MPHPKPTLDAGDKPLKIHKVPRAHLVGIAGAGMRSLADILDAQGYRISGSDPNCDAALAARFAIEQEHRATAVDRKVDLVIHSDAVPRDNPELARARELEIDSVSYPQMLGRLMESRLGIAIAGTHGKSTATAMTAEILAAAGIDATVAFGASPVAGGSGGRLGRSHWMVAEACEYRANFRFLKPQIAAVLGIEPDHFDCFASAKEMEQAFAAFCKNVPAEGLVLSRAECPTSNRVVKKLPCTNESFGMTPAATWTVTGLRARRGYYSFQIRCRGRLVGDVKLSVPGRHNVLNALAAAALASHSGATGPEIHRGLSQFAGLKRRLELLVDGAEIAVLDDFAHHPTEVVAGLATVRQIYPGRRVWCVFQPHQASRTRHLLDELANSLQNADKILVAEVFRAREAAAIAGEVTAADLAKRTRRLGADAVHLASAAKIRDHLKDSLAPGDVVITVGAGDIGKLAHELAQEHRTFCKAG